MARTEILISGFGGQGVVRIGQTIGLAAVLSDLQTTMLVSHGTETRGGYVRTQVVLSDETVDSPVVESPDIFCAMSKAAYERFYRMADESGLIIYDSAYVEPDLTAAARQIAVPARDLSANKFGKELFANMILYGYMIRILNGKIRKEQAIEALKQRIPRALEENLKAFELGFHLGYADIYEEIDITDAVCPITFVKAKVAMEELESGQVLAIRMNDGEPVQNVPRSMKEEGHQVLKLTDNEDGTYTLFVRKGEEQKAASERNRT